MLKFGIKTCIAAGAVYYLADQGVWKESRESTKLYGQMYSAVQPYLKDVKTQLPIVVPELPSTDRVSFLAKQYWNKGVSATFVFIGDLPKNTFNLTKCGFNAARKNPEIRKFIDSLQPARTNDEQKK